MPSLDDWLCEQMDRIRTGDYEDPRGDHNHRQAADPSSDGPDPPSGRPGPAYQVDDTDFSHLSEQTICGDQTAAGDQTPDAPNLSFGRSETPSDDEDLVDGLDRVPLFEQTETNSVAAVDQTPGAPDQPSGPSQARYNRNDIDSLFSLETIQDDEEGAANQTPDVPDPSPSREQPQHQVYNHEGSIRGSEETILSRQASHRRVSAVMEGLTKWREG